MVLSQVSVFTGRWQHGKLMTRKGQMSRSAYVSKSAATSAQKSRKFKNGQIYFLGGHLLQDMERKVVKKLPDI